MVKFEEKKYVDGYLKENMDSLNKAVDLKWDGLGYLSGFEGDGKTTLGQQICYYLDNTFNIDRVVFTGQQFYDAVNQATKKQAIMFDESYHTFTNSAYHEKITKLIISQLTMIRKKQLFIIIIAPTFFDIRKYIAIHRSRFLINVYAQGLQRGFFSFYNRDKKLTLYVKGKRDNDMRVVKPNFRGRFTKWSILDEKIYEDKKDAAIKDLNKAQQAPEDTKFRDLYLKTYTHLVIVTKSVTSTEMANAINYHPKSLIRLIKKGNDTGNLAL